MPTATPLPPAAPGRIGHYRLAGRLVLRAPDDGPPSGGPGAGTVYLARTARNEPVTITLLDPLAVTDSATRDRFVAEARAARRVAPLCAARILDSGFHGDFPYLVCEYIPGPTVTEAVHIGGPASGDALEAIAIGGATGLAAVHQAGLVHGDFGPHRVVLGWDGPRILHAGISPPYGPFTPTGDLLAWAQMVLFAASGDEHGPSRPEDVAGLPESLHEVIADCLDADPASRPTAKMVVTRLLGYPSTPAGVLAEGARISGGLGRGTPGTGRNAATAAETPARIGAARRRPAPFRPAVFPAGSLPSGSLPAGALPAGSLPAGPVATGPRPAAFLPGARAGGASPGATTGTATGTGTAAGMGEGAGLGEGAAEDGYRNRDAVSASSPNPRPAAGRIRPGGLAGMVSAGRPARPAPPERGFRRLGRPWAGVAAGTGALAAIAGFVFLQHDTSRQSPAAMPGHVRRGDLRPSGRASAPSGAATPEIPAAFGGTWAGKVRQRSALGLKFAAQITLTGGGRHGTVDYPSLGCSGPLTPVEATNQRLVVQQEVASGQQTCGQGTITLTRRTDGTLSYSFAAQTAGGPSTSGTLSRR